MLALLLIALAVLYWIYIFPAQMEDGEFFHTRHGVVTKRQQGVLAILVFVLFGLLSLFCGIKNLVDEIKNSNKRIHSIAGSAAQSDA